MLVFKYTFGNRLDFYLFCLVSQLSAQFYLHFLYFLDFFLISCIVDIYTNKLHTNIDQRESYEHFYSFIYYSSYFKYYKLHSAIYCALASLPICVIVEIFCFDCWYGRRIVVIVWNVVLKLIVVMIYYQVFESPIFKACDYNSKIFIVKSKCIGI